MRGRRRAFLKRFIERGIGGDASSPDDASSVFESTGLDQVPSFWRWRSGGSVRSARFATAASRSRANRAITASRSAIAASSISTNSSRRARSRAAVAAANALRSRGTRDVSRRSGREAACCAQGPVASAPFPSTALRSRAAAAAARRAAVFFWRAETAFDAVFDTRGLVTIAQLPMMRLSCAGGTNALAWRRVGTLSSGCETLEMGKLGITRHPHSLGPLNSPTYPNTAFRTCNCLEGQERTSLGDCWAPEWPT